MLREELITVINDLLATKYKDGQVTFVQVRVCDATSFEVVLNFPSTQYTRKSKSWTSFRLPIISFNGVAAEINCLAAVTEELDKAIKDYWRQK
jgi:hypothetical protein